MTLQRFQGIVLKLGNQMFVRHYLCINYPNDPQSMGIELLRPAQSEYGLECSARLTVELTELGFAFNESLSIWTIDRSEA